MITSTLKILTEEDKEACEVVKVSEEEPAVNKKRLFIESYGCQMNFSDSEIVAAVMRNADFATTSSEQGADVIFLNTCSIRDNAEQKVRHRLQHLNTLKKKNPGIVIGVLGCMAERLKTQFLEEEKMVDIVAGPDSYRDLPRLVEEAETGQKGVNVFLSREETYADISPIRLNSNGISAYISIMRGCDNMCSFCVVPFTRGRERSRDPQSILKEAQELLVAGYKEVTLLGQNVDSYKHEGTNFAQLLEMVAQLSPELRVRFSTSHPKDITDDVLHAMAKYDNICNYIHLPAQSGNSRVLKIMNRTYDRDWYIQKIDRIREILGEDCGISTDMITGFCTETEEEHQDTLSLMEYVNYDYAYMFAYSERPNTPAAKKFKDDIPEDIKKRRLQEVIEVQLKHSLARNKTAIGKVHRVLIEGPSKRSDADLCGRNDQNKVIVFPREAHLKAGDYVDVLVTECSSATLLGRVVENSPKTISDKKVSGISFSTVLNAFIFAFFLFSANVFAQKSTWRVTLKRSGFELPFGLEISPKANGKFEVYSINGTERLLLDESYVENDSLHVPMAIFDADLVMKMGANQMNGYYKRFRNGAWQNWLPLTAIKGAIYQFSKENVPTKINISGKYQAAFDKPNGDSTRAIGVFEQKGSKVMGTFLTATGDYRFLAGDVLGDSLFLSCYDGSHVYLFRAAINGSKLNGGLWSGAVGFQTWRAFRNENAQLPDPYKMAMLKDGNETLDFTFPDSKGNKISINDARFKNKVVVLQLMGTWCPNCMDETRFLVPWYNKNAKRGVEVVGLAFERNGDLKVSGPKIDFMQKRFAIPYPVLLAGTNDDKAIQSLPQLTRIAGYPTTIFIDKKGKVRLIHTGFSGPGTGKYYDEYIRDFNALITKLLAE